LVYSRDQRIKKKGKNKTEGFIKAVYESLLPHFLEHNEAECLLEDNITIYNGKIQKLGTILMVSSEWCRIYWDHHIEIILLTPCQKG
jgi:hypothetical protein